MKDGLRFVDCDMHIMEPVDLWERYLDPRFRDRVTTTIGADGKSRRGTIVIDGLPTTMDAELQQYRKRSRPGVTHSSQPLSGSRLADTGRLDFAIERGYNAEAQVMGMAMEGVDIAVLYPTTGLSLIARDNLDPKLSLAICQAYNNWISEFCSYSPERLKFVAMLPVHDVHLASHWIEMQQALVAMIIGGVFEFHPKLRVGFLEAQNSWAPGLLSRIEWDYPQYHDTHAPYLTMMPREYFRRNCWAAVEGSEPE